MNVRGHRETSWVWLHDGPHLTSVREIDIYLTLLNLTTLRGLLSVKLVQLFSFCLALKILKRNYFKRVKTLLLQVFPLVRYTTLWKLNFPRLLCSTVKDCARDVCNPHRLQTQDSCTKPLLLLLMQFPLGLLIQDIQKKLFMGKKKTSGIFFHLL